MAKRKKKGKKRSVGGKGVVANGALLGTFAGGVLGKVVERVLADTIEDFIHTKRGHDRHAKRHPANDEASDDVAARLLAALADGGAKSVAQLLTETGLGLSAVLRALQSLREFRLIALVGEPGEESIEVTRSGAHAATAVRAHHIRSEAARLLEC